MLTLGGTLLGIILRDLYGEFQFSETPKFLILITIVALICFLIYILFKIEDLRNEQSYNIKTIKSSFNGLNRIGNDEGMELIIKEINKASEYRIIGVGRQYIIDKLDDKVVKKYMKSIEKRVSQKQYFIMKRITKDHLNSYFLNHLNKLLSEGSRNRHSVQIACNNIVTSSIQYVVIDERLVIVNVTNPVIGDVNDTKLNFYSYNKEVVKEFKEHFDRIWENEQKINSENELNSAISLI